MQTDGVQMVSQNLGLRARASDSSEPAGPEGRAAAEAGGVQPAGGPVEAATPAVEISPEAARRASAAGDASGATVARPVDSANEAQSLLNEFLAAIQERPDTLFEAQRSPSADTVGALVS